MITNLVGLPQSYIVNERHVKALRASGLTDETIQSARVYSATSKQVHRLLGWPAGTGLVFDYGNGYWRAKLDTPQPDGKQYRAPADTYPRLYVPAALDASILQDPTQLMVITEGEKKAQRAVQDGLPCVAFPGAWGWSYGHKPGPELDRIPWQGRPVVIIFDADAAWNPQVALGEARLTHELHRRGAWVFVLRLPARRGDKVGLDDFLLCCGPERLLDLIPIEIRSSHVFPSRPTPILVIGGQDKREEKQRDPEKLAQCAVGEVTARFLWTSWGNPEPFALDRLCHSPLDPNKRRKGTRFVMFQGRVMVAVEGSKRYWPQAVFFYHALKKLVTKRGHRGKYKLSPIKPSWLPVWDALLRIEAGELPFDDVVLFGGIEGEVATAWLKVRRVRLLHHPNEDTLFDPWMIAALTQRPKAEVVAAWDWLVLYGYVEKSEASSDKTTFYRLGKDPHALERAMQHLGGLYEAM
jgi:Domain of unknown function (DUF3854)